MSHFRLASHLFRRHRALAVASTAVVAVSAHHWLVQGDNNNNNQDDQAHLHNEDEQQQPQRPAPTTILSIPSRRNFSIPTALPLRTSCQSSNSATTLLQPSILPSNTNITTTTSNTPMPKKKSLLRRRSTAEALQATATHGRRLSDAYYVEVEDCLGEGAFGAVYRAFDKITGEAVAVKKIAKRHTSSEALEREMNALLALQQAGGHPHICSLREHFDEGDSFYLVLDLVEGGEMFYHLAELGAYSEADAARFFRQVASALALLHGAGIVHSDLKPENLMLSTADTEDAVIKVVDFGCAHFHDDNNNKSGSSNKSSNNQTNVLNSSSDLPIGTSRTPAYCPPEVVQMYKHGHGQIKSSFDMWSLGVILYIMLTGVHPFDPDGDRTDTEMEVAIVQGQLPLRDSPITAHLSNDAIAVMEGLLSYDPEQRWTADQLLRNDWVCGKTASTRLMEQSDQRLASYRKHKTKVGSNYFREMLKHSAVHGGSDVARRTSILETAFRVLEKKECALTPTNSSPRTLANSSCEVSPEDASLSFSEISGLLSENMKDRYFQKGEVIYREGETGNSMYFVNSGSVLSTNREGFQKERKVGEFFGVGALMNEDKTRHSDTTCLSHVHAIEISRETFDKYLKADQDVELAMLETDRLRKRDRVKTILGLQQNMKILDFEQDEIIFSEGAPGHYLYILEEGKVDMSVHGHKVRSLKKGQMAGEHAAFHKHNDKPYNVTARCVGDTCKLSALSFDDMHRLFEANPSLRDSFHDITLRRDFRKALVAATQRPFPETVEELRKAFDIIDLEGSGEIKRDGLRAMVRQFDPTYSDSDIKIMFDSLNLTKSGALTWNEFKHIFGIGNEG